MTIPNEGFILGTGSNYSLIIKRLFLSFAQALFAGHTKYTWKPNIHDTNIFIADKYSLNQEILEKKPSIILERGGMRWLYSSMAQRSNINIASRQRDYTDLIKGSIRFSCLAKNGLVAEEIALALLNALTGYKVELKKKGIHQVIDITVGEETLLKSDSTIELTVVPVIIVYTTQKKLSYSIDFYSIYVTQTIDNTVIILIENIDYTVRQNVITFTEAPPANAVLNAIYISALTLEELSEEPTPACDGVTTTFYLTDSVYGYGAIVETMKITLTGMETDPDTWEKTGVVSGWIDV